MLFHFSLLRWRFFPCHSQHWWHPVKIWKGPECFKFVSRCWRVSYCGFHRSHQCTIPMGSKQMLQVSNSYLIHSLTFQTLNFDHRVKGGKSQNHEKIISIKSRNINIKIITAYKTWILSVGLFVCSHFPDSPKVSTSWNFGSRRHLGQLKTRWSPIFSFFIFTDSRNILKLGFRDFNRKSQPF